MAYQPRCSRAQADIVANAWRGFRTGEPGACMAIASVVRAILKPFAASMNARCAELDDIAQTVLLRLLASLSREQVRGNGRVVHPAGLVAEVARGALNDNHRRAARRVCVQQTVTACGAESESGDCVVAARIDLDALMELAEAKYGFTPAERALVLDMNVSQQGKRGISIPSDEAAGQHRIRQRRYKAMSKLRAAARHHAVSL